MKYYCNKLILADDDEDERLLFSIAKDTIDQEIDLLIFNDGEDLIEYMNKDHEVPGILFLDINMPRMTGLKCLKEIRNSILWKDVPVVMYSISGNETDIHNSMIGGAQVYMLKPYNIPILAEMIKWTMQIDWKNTVLNQNDFLITERTWKKKE